MFILLARSTVHFVLLILVLLYTVFLIVLNCKLVRNKLKKEFMHKARTKQWSRPTRKPNRPDPTRQVLDRSENIRVWFRVLFSGSGWYQVSVGSFIYSSLNSIFFKKKPYSNKGLSLPLSATSQVSISQNITAHHQCQPQTTHHSHHPRIVETTLLSPNRKDNFAKTK